VYYTPADNVVLRINLFAPHERTNNVDVYNDRMYLR